MKKIFSTLLAVSLFGVLALPACDKGTEYEASDELFVALENSKLERFDSVELELGEGVKEVAWSSSNERVAVIENGELICLKAGMAVISAVRGNEKQEQTITVVDEGKTPTIDVDYLPVIRGDSYEMAAKAFFNGSELSDVSFNYSVANTSIATLTNNVLSGVAYGETTVTISLSWRGQANVATKTVPCSVTQNVAVYTDKAEYTLYTMPSVLGTEFAIETQLETKVYYEGKKMDGLTLTWESGDTNIATVDANGKVSAVAYGETYVVGTCEYNGETLSTRKVPVKVEKPHLKTKVDVPVKVGCDATFDAETTLGEGYSIGKVVDLATGIDYSCTDNIADLSRLDTGEYTFAVYEENEAFSAEVNVVVADYLVSTVADLQKATAAMNAYVVLVNDLNVGTFENKSESNANNGADGTFNGLGHTLTITYAKNLNSLYTYVNDFTFKNLAVKCAITAAKQSGSLFAQVVSSGTLNIENCYLESTIEKATAEQIGGIGEKFWGSCTVNISNTIVKVNGLDRSDYVQEQCGALFSTWLSSRYSYDNVYVIAAGTLASVANSTQANIVNKQTGVLYQNEEAFAAAKDNGMIALDGFNHYWDLNGTIPKFKQ